MLECLIMGDSIAVGTKMFAPKECVSYSKGGFNTWQWNKKWGSTPLDAEIVVISLGTNDHQYIKTDSELRKARHRIHAKKVVWVVPHANLYPKGGRKIEETNAIIYKIAHEYKDAIVTTPYYSKDNIHPSWRGYKDIVKKAGL